MRKLLFFFLSILKLSIAFVSCSDTVTYAELRDREEKAISKFINDSNITVITQTQFFDQDSVTNLSKNEFVHLASGVYMQIVDKGSANPADTIRPNDEVLVRFSEHYLGQDTAYQTVSNLDIVYMVDEFRYTVTSTSIAGLFTNQGMMYNYYSSTQVPAGWLVPLAYVRSGAHVRIIVPSKMGHNTAMQSVTPYYYDIRKYQFYR